jgi:hypothetical protein
MVPLKPAHKYSVEIQPLKGNATAAGANSDAFFGSQPLTTLQPGVPDRLDFTTRRLPVRFTGPFYGSIWNMQVLFLLMDGHIDIACVCALAV